MNAIKEAEIRVFIDAVDRYFLRLTAEKASIRGAYLDDRDTAPANFGFTGLISISGGFRGHIYISAPRAMIRHVLVAMHESDHSDENLLDSVGELANTIAGNAREYFGETMEISVPIAILGMPEAIRSPVRARPYVVTIEWKGYSASLVVDIERKAQLN
jgi:chemotaxis protein CheX